MVKKMTEEEARKFCEERCTFLEYKDIQEYIEDIVVCLVYSSWHYSEERARELCKEGMALLMTHLRKLVIVAGRCRVATVKRLSRLSLNKDILAFISVLGRQGKKQV